VSLDLESLYPLEVVLQSVEECLNGNLFLHRQVEGTRHLNLSVKGDTDRERERKLETGLERRRSQTLYGVWWIDERFDMRPKGWCTDYDGSPLPTNASQVVSTGSEVAFAYEG
jgi:hypothetical protein